MSELTSNKLIQTCPELVFLDTNILDSLPIDLRSGELSLLLENAARIDITVAIPKIVLLEWLKHRSLSSLKHLRNIREGFNYIKKYKNDAVSIGIDDATLQHLVTEQQKDLLNKLGIQIAPLHSINIDKIVTNAVEEIPPFKKEDRGFKDEIIVLSLIEYAHKLESPSAMLISSDSVFREQALRDRFKSENIELIVAASLEDANKWFDDFLKQDGRAFDALRRQKAYEFFQEHWEEIRDAITRHVDEVGAYDKNLFPSGKIPPATLVSKILKVDPLGIESLTLGYGRPVLLDDPTQTPITIYVKVEFDLVLETYSGDFWHEALFGHKVGFEGREEKNKIRKVFSRITSQPTVLVEAIVITDAQDNFSTFQISQVLL